MVRYCGNVGRQHRHNNVFYVVGRGEARQKCFDPDCKFYMGEGFNVEGWEEMEMQGIDEAIFEDIDAHPELWP
jgi:hypothetical protein